MADITAAELELQFQERNRNLKNTVNDLVDGAKDKTQGVAETIQDRSSEIMNSTLQATDFAESRASNTTMDSSEGFGPFFIDQRMMHSIDHDLSAMKSRSAEGFEPIAAKIDENFGNNALFELE